MNCSRGGLTKGILGNHGTEKIQAIRNLFALLSFAHKYTKPGIFWSLEDIYYFGVLALRIGAMHGH